MCRDLKRLMTTRYEKALREVDPAVLKAERQKRRRHPIVSALWWVLMILVTALWFAARRAT